MVFQQIAAKAATGFSYQIKIFENMAFGHVREVSSRKKSPFKKSPINTSCRLRYTVCNATKNEFLTKCRNGVLKFTKIFLEVISNWVCYKKFTDL